MKTSRQLILKLHNQKGATAVVIAIVMAALIGFVALAIDVGYVAVTKNELQNIADAATLAGAGQLGNIYQGLTYDEQQVLSLYVNDVSAIKIEAKSVVGDEKNQAGGEYIDIYDVDIFINKWPETSVDSNNYNQPNAVRVKARRDSSSNNGPISTFFAKIFGIETLDVSADATAALTGLGSCSPQLPVGIAKYWFDVHDPFCDRDIKLHPTGDLDSCAGWHTYKDWKDYKAWPANAAKLKKILDGLDDGTFEIPETYPGDEYVFIGGDVASRFDEMQALYDKKKDENGKWEVTIPVYDYEDCSNPHGNIMIVGLASAVVTEVIGPPDKIITATIKCDYVKIGKGSGAEYGSLGTIPTLVE